MPSFQSVFAITYFTFCFFSIQTKAQTLPLSTETRLKNGPFNSSKDRLIDIDPIGKDSTGSYWLFTTDYGKYEIKLKKSIFLINNNLEVDSTKRFEIKNLDLFDFAAVLKGNLYCFNSTKKKDFKFTISGQRINTTTFKEEVEPKIVSSGQDYFRNDKSALNFFMHEVSSDGTYLLIYNINNTNKNHRDRVENKNIVPMHFTVLDFNLNVVWERDLEYQTINSEFVIKTISVDSHGIVSMTTLERDPTSIEPTKCLHFYKYSSDSTKDISSPFRIQSKFIFDLKTKNTINGDIILTGFYTDETYSISHGVFYYLFDTQSLTFEIQKTIPFEREFIDYFDVDPFGHRGSNFKREFKPGFGNLYLNQIILKEDGSVFLIAEQLYDYYYSGVNQSAYAIGMPSHYFYVGDHYYENVIIFNFNINGDLIWKTKIEKHQLERMHSSYSFIYGKTNLYIIYNDNPDNYPRKAEHEIYIYDDKSQSETFIAVIDSMGLTTFKRLIFAPSIWPARSIQTGQNELMLIGSRNKSYAFRKITFE